MSGGAPMPLPLPYENLVLGKLQIYTYIGKVQREHGKL